VIGLIVDVAGASTAVQRTFITRDGQKATVERVRASLGRVWDGAIRLADMVDGKPIVIGEGIESSASAGQLMNLPAWAAISAGNLAKGLVLPPEAHHIVIAADDDEPGRDAARDRGMSHFSCTGENDAHRGPPVRLAPRSGREC
jgi:putative DNA primase/helicase